MPDITMCRDRDCPIRMDCYRFRAIPDRLTQSWFIESPRKPGAARCTYFNVLMPGDRLIKPSPAPEVPAASPSRAVAGLSGPGRVELAGRAKKPGSGA